MCDEVAAGTFAVGLSGYDVVNDLHFGDGNYSVIEEVLFFFAGDVLGYE